MRPLLFGLIAGIALVLSGCASTDPDPDPEPSYAVSSIPWGGPQKGDQTGGPFGGLGQPSR